MSALWCRYCYGETESGKPIPPNDPNWERLQEAAKPARVDPYAFLGLRDIFGDLAENPTYVGAFSDALSAMGARRSTGPGRLSVGEAVSGTGTPEKKIHVDGGNWMS